MQKYGDLLYEEVKKSRITFDLREAQAKKKKDQIVN